MTFQLSIGLAFLPACSIPGDGLPCAFVNLEMARRYSVLETLEPRWTLQGAPVGRPFASPKGDLAHIVGSVSQSMHRTSNTRGLWAADMLAPPKAHQRVNTTYCHIGQPPAIHAEAAAGLSLWSALALQSASCLCANCGMNHTLKMEWSGGSGPATTPSLHAAAAALSCPLIRRLHTTRLQIICGLS